MLLINLTKCIRYSEVFQKVPVAPHQGWY